MTDPEPCPFCGSDDVVLIIAPTRPDDCYVQCRCCRAESPHTISRDIAVHCWNLLSRDSTPKFPTIKPCPFCGHSDRLNILKREGRFNIYCKSCNAGGSLADTEEKAIELWNRRAKI